jgi:signal transduction histidine kinase
MNGERELTMKKSPYKFYHTIAGMVFLSLLVAAHGSMAAGETGTAEEAKAMLERAVAAIKEDEAAALTAFTAGDDDFKDRDLYVFCGGADDGVMTAHGANDALVGQSLRDISDKAGKKFGEEFYMVATEGEFSVVEYVWPRPGETEPSPKASYITKAGNQVCGVGFYK